MKKGPLLIIVLIAFFVGAIILGFVLQRNDNKSSYKQNFALPNGFKGCAYVVYNVDGAPPLKIKDDTITYHFNNEGIAVTSSPQDFGWEGQEYSGSFDSKFYYVNENGEKVKDLEIDRNILGMSTGEASVQDNTETLYKLSFTVGNKNLDCDTNLEEVFQKAHKKYE